MKPLEKTRVALVSTYLAEYHGKRKEAAKALGCSIRSLTNWIYQYDALKKWRTKDK